MSSGNYNSAGGGGPYPQTNYCPQQQQQQHRQQQQSFPALNGQNVPRAVIYTPPGQQQQYIHLNYNVPGYGSNHNNQGYHPQQQSLLNGSSRSSSMTTTAATAPSSSSSSSSTSNNVGQQAPPSRQFSPRQQQQTSPASSSSSPRSSSASERQQQQHQHRQPPASVITIEDNASTPSSEENGTPAPLSASFLESVRARSRSYFTTDLQIAIDAAQEDTRRFLVREIGEQREKTERLQREFWSRLSQEVVHEQVDLVFTKVAAKLKAANEAIFERLLEDPLMARLNGQLAQTQTRAQQSRPQTQTQALVQVQTQQQNQISARLERQRSEERERLQQQQQQQLWAQQDHQEGVPGGGRQQPPRSPLSLDASTTTTTTTTEKSSSPLLSPKDLPASKQALKCTCPGAKQKTEVPTKKKTTPPKKKKPGSSSSSTQTQQHFPFKKLLATITATRSLTLTTGDTEICFDDAAIAFRTAIPVEANDNGNGGGSSKEGGGGGRPRKQFVFRSRVVRLKLERIRHGAVGSHHLMGFVDVDLAQLRQNCLKVSGSSSPSSPSPSSSSPSNSLNSYSSNSSSFSSSAYIHLPFIFFTDYSRHIGRHHHHLISRFTGAPRFSFDLRLKLDSTPLESNFNRQKVLGASSSNSTLLTVPSSPNLDDLDLWISAESLLMTTTAGGHLRDDQGGNGSIESSSSSSSSSGVSSLMVSRSISGSGSSSTSSSQSLYLSQLLLRRDSLPNQSDDRELKYHDTPSISRTAHLLNLLGMLPPGQLFRVSIHFGQLEQLDELLQLTTEQQQQQMACIPKKPTSAAASVYASFEVKHQKHQPTIFYAHHQRSSICCRTRPLTSDDFLVNGGGHRGEEGGGGEGEGVRNGSSSHGDSPGNSFDQHFTFFERFHVRDSPPTVLAIRHGSTGKKLFTYRCHLADYITARSVNQFFCLSSEKALFKASGGGGGGSGSSMANNSANTVCRLQFSIAVKPVVIAGTSSSSSSSSSMTSKVEGVGAAASASAFVA